MDGWLEVPGCRNVLRLHIDPSARYDAMVFIDSGEAIPHQPALLKRRERLTRRDAVDRWLTLRKASWMRVEPQW